MTRKTTSICALGLMSLAAICAPAGTAQAIVVTDFDDGTLQGWEAIADPRNGAPFGGIFEAVPTGGNPGGFARVIDTTPSGGALLIAGPAAFQGDLSVYTELHWDEYLYADNALDFSTRPFLLGSDGTLWSQPEPAGPPDVWRHRSTLLEDSSWNLVAGTMSFADVLADGRVGFQMALSGGPIPDPEAGIDNITLVPEPGALVMLGALVLPTVLLRRRTAQR